MQNKPTTSSDESTDFGTVNNSHEEHVKIEKKKHFRKTKVNPHEEEIVDDCVEWGKPLLGNSYISFRCNSTMISLGDYIYLNPPDHNKTVRDAYYILCVKRLWENENGDKLVSGTWMWRHSDIVIHCCGKDRERNILTHDPQQVYYCEESNTDANPLETCGGRCQVLFLENADQFKQLGFAGKQHIFYCLYGYDAKQKTIFRAPKAWIAESYQRREKIIDFMRSQFVKTPALSVIDLFAGCGGLSYGLQNAGFTIKYAVDNNKDALDTFTTNMPNTRIIQMDIVELLEKMREKEALMKRLYQLASLPKKKRANAELVSDSDEECEIVETGTIVEKVTGMLDNSKFFCTIKHPSGKIEKKVLLHAQEIANFDTVFEFVQKRTVDIPSKGDVQVVVGGPPCQEYSTANRKKKKDSVNSSMLFRFIDVVQILQPAYVLIENVPNMINMVLGDIQEKFKSIGYKSKVAVLAAFHFGLPQTRARSFIWCARGNYPLPLYPKSTHACRHVNTVIHREIKRCISTYPRLEHSGPLPQVTIRDLVSDLANLPSNNHEQPYTTAPATVYQERMRNPTGKVTCHDCVQFKKNSLGAMRLKAIPPIPGASIRDMPLEVVKCLPKSTDCYRQNAYSRQTWFGMFITVRTTLNMQVGPVIHPTKRRLFTVRELARAQGFPDWFDFCGSLVDRYRQVGNAVPVILAQRLGEQLMSAHMSYLRGRREYDQTADSLTEQMATILKDCYAKALNTREPDIEAFEELIKDIPIELQDPLDDEIEDRQSGWEERLKHIGANEKGKKRKCESDDELEDDFLLDSSDEEENEVVDEDEEEFDEELEDKENDEFLAFSSSDKEMEDDLEYICEQNGDDSDAESSDSSLELDYVDLAYSSTDSEV